MLGTTPSTEPTVSHNILLNPKGFIVRQEEGKGARATGSSTGDSHSQELSTEIDAPMEDTQQKGCEDVPDIFFQNLFWNRKTNQTMEMESEQTVEQGQDTDSQPGRSHTIIYFIITEMYPGFIKAEFLGYDK